MNLGDEFRVFTIEGLRLRLADLTADQLRHFASLDDKRFEQALGDLDD